MEERPSPAPSSPVPLASAIDEAVTALGQAVRREVRRAILGMVVGLVTIVLLLVVALGFVVTGVMRLGDALGRLCGSWFGDQVLGDVTVGLALLLAPIIAAALLRLRTWW